MHQSEEYPIKFLIYIHTELPATICKSQRKFCLVGVSNRHTKGHGTMIALAVPRTQVSEHSDINTLRYRHRNTFLEICAVMSLRRSCS